MIQIDDVTLPDLSNMKFYVVDDGSCNIISTGESSGIVTLVAFVDAIMYGISEALFPINIFTTYNGEQIEDDFQFKIWDLMHYIYHYMCSYFYVCYNYGDYTCRTSHTNVAMFPMENVGNLYLGGTGVNSTVFSDTYAQEVPIIMNSFNVFGTRYNMITNAYNVESIYPDSNCFDAIDSDIAFADYSQFFINYVYDNEDFPDQLLLSNPYSATQNKDSYFYCGGGYALDKDRPWESIIYPVCNNIDFLCEAYTWGELAYIKEYIPIMIPVESFTS